MNQAVIESLGWRVDKNRRCYQMWGYNELIGIYRKCHTVDNIQGSRDSR
jgi:hypothetical protein